MSLATIIEADAEAVLAKFTGISQEFLAQILPILEGDAGELLQKIFTIGVPIVEGLAAGSLPGSAKQSAAFSSIKTAATSAGIQATTQAINLAIELAVANLPKAQVPTA